MRYKRHYQYGFQFHWTRSIPITAAILAGWVNLQDDGIVDNMECGANCIRTEENIFIIIIIRQQLEEKNKSRN